MLRTEWETFLTTTSLSECQIELFGTLIVQLLFFWVPGILLLLLHQYLVVSAKIQSPQPRQAITHRIIRHIPFRLQTIPHSPSRSTSSRSIQKHTRPQPSIPDLFTRVLLNQLYLFLTHTLLLTLFPSPFIITASLPSLNKLAIDLAIALPIADYLFYILHRTLHTYPRLYNSIHRIHHRWKHPLSLAAQYAHPVEFLIGNCWVVWAPLAGMGWIGRMGLLKGITPEWRWANEGVHVVEWWVLWAGVLLETVVVHGGVEVVWVWEGGSLGGSHKQRGVVRRHDLHHEVGAGGGRRIVDRGGSGEVPWKGRRKRWGNFGTFWWMDWLHGTEIVSLDIDSDLDSPVVMGGIKQKTDLAGQKRMQERKQAVYVFPARQEKDDYPDFCRAINEAEDENGVDSGVEVLDYTEDSL